MASKRDVERLVDVLRPVKAERTLNLGDQMIRFQYILNKLINKRRNLFTILKILKNLKNKSKTPHRIYRDGHFYRPATVYNYVNFLWKTGLVEVSENVKRRGAVPDVKYFSLTRDGETFLEIGEKMLKKLISTGHR